MPDLETEMRLVHLARRLDAEGASDLIALSSKAGMSPSQSGKRKTMCSAPGDVVVRRVQAGRDAAFFPFLLAAQQRKVQRCRNNLSNGVPCTLCAVRIGRGKRVSQVRAARIWVGLDDQDSLGHAGHLRVGANLACACGVDLCAGVLRWTTFADMLAQRDPLTSRSEVMWTPKRIRCSLARKPRVVDSNPAGRTRRCRYLAAVRRPRPAVLTRPSRH